MSSIHLHAFSHSNHSLKSQKKALFLKVVHCYKKHIGLAKDINFLHLINKNIKCSRNLYRNSNPFMYVGWYDGWWLSILVCRYIISVDGTICLSIRTKRMKCSFFLNFTINPFCNKCLHSWLFRFIFQCPHNLAIHWRRKIFKSVVCFKIVI